MTPSVWDKASMLSTVLRVRDVKSSVGWYRNKLGLEPLHVGADGPDHPFATFVIAGAVITLWQLPTAEALVMRDSDQSSYVVIVMDIDLDAIRALLMENGVEVSEVRRSTNNEYLWFHDPDGNRFELSRPRTPNP
jgi:catechol 2,3-dioxygenase-like lactoylglutathione lyase family enzyme